MRRELCARFALAHGVCTHFGEQLVSPYDGSSDGVRVRHDHGRRGTSYCKYCGQMRRVSDFSVLELGIKMEVEAGARARAGYRKLSNFDAIAFLNYVLRV